VALKNPIRKTIQPVPGRLMLFPSYLWHRTVPFHDEAPTTIACDVVPQM
jgi:putative 2-oxoglutarate-Fe(II)-dependent oxygenase superfamily protein